MGHLEKVIGLLALVLGHLAATTCIYSVVLPMQLGEQAMDSDPASCHRQEADDAWQHNDSYGLLFCTAASAMGTGSATSCVRASSTCTSATYHDSVVAL